MSGADAVPGRVSRHPSSSASSTGSTSRAWTAVTNFTLEVSYDDGASWATVRTKQVSSGRYRATIANPSTAEHVSLRATDSDGSRIEQTIIRAYGLD